MPCTVHASPARRLCLGLAMVSRTAGEPRAQRWGGMQYLPRRAQALGNHPAKGCGRSWGSLSPRLRLGCPLPSPPATPQTGFAPLGAPAWALGRRHTHATRSEGEDNVEMQTGGPQPVPVFVKDRETASSAGVMHTALLAQGSSPEAAAPPLKGPTLGCWV